MIELAAQHPNPTLIVIMVIALVIMYKLIRYLSCREVKRIDKNSSDIKTRLTTIEARESKCRETLHLEYVDRNSCKDNVVRIEKSSDQISTQVANMHTELSKMNRELGTLNGELKRMNGNDK